MKDFARQLAAMLRFLRTHTGECLGDHPEWLSRIDVMLTTKIKEGDMDYRGVNMQRTAENKGPSPC